MATKRSFPSRNDKSTTRVCIKKRGESWASNGFRYEDKHLDLAAINHTQAIRYARRFHIGDIDQDNIIAKLSAGVLSLELPKVELAKPTQVKVTAA